jgi:signal transduction histidine kinase
MKPHRLVASLLLCACPVLSASDQKPQAIALVKAAVAYGKLHGRAELLRETNMSTGRFHAKAGSELYIFIFDEKGQALAHGSQAAMVNINRLDARDPDGKFFVREFIQSVSAKGNSWVAYNYTSPKSGRTEIKTSYLEPWDTGHRMRNL